MTGEHKCPGESVIARRDRVMLPFEASPVVASMRKHCRERRAHPCSATLAVPLAMNATALESAWWAWSVCAVTAWWLADREWKWSWFVTLECGLVGTGWCFIGVMGLTTFPDNVPAVTVMWVGPAALLAAAGMQVRHAVGDVLITLATRTHSVHELALLGRARPGAEHIEAHRRGSL